MGEECVFCKIVEGELPSHKVYETDKWLAFLDAEPVSKGHTLVVPKQHVESIHGAKGMNFMWDALVKTADAVKEAFDANGINIDQNNGEVAGQEVFHMHFHVTPRYDGSEVQLDYDRSQLENGDELAQQISELIDR